MISLISLADLKCIKLFTGIKYSSISCRQLIILGLLSINFKNQQRIYKKNTKQHWGEVFIFQTASSSGIASHLQKISFKETLNNSC